MLDRQIGLTCPQPEPTANVPAQFEARVQGQRTVDQRHHRVDVFAEISEYGGGKGEDTGVASGHANSLLRQFDGFAAVRLAVFGPSVEIELAMAERRDRESRPVTQITLDRLPEQSECRQCGFSFPSVGIRKST